MPTAARADRDPLARTPEGSSVAVRRNKNETFAGEANSGVHFRALAARVRQHIAATVGETENQTLESCDRPTSHERAAGQRYVGAWETS